MSEQNQIFTICRRISHHSVHGGYDQLARYIGEPVSVPAFLRRVRGLGPLHRYFRRRSGMEWYDGLYAELFTAMHMRKHAGALYHFFFAENDYRYLPALKPAKDHNVVATFHATPSEFGRVMKHTNHLKSLDAAIVVAGNQISVLQNVMGKDKVFFVPHGVDTDYFTPLSVPFRSVKRCLCVGHHHRDFETLARVAAIVKKGDSSARFVVVNRVFSTYFSREQQTKIEQSFESAGNIELRKDLSDEELLHLYQTSDLMVLPLFDATANVAVLEAISCGLPLVVTDLDGIRDYAGNDALYAPAQDAGAMAGHVLRILHDSKERDSLSNQTRNRALRYDWGTIAEQVRQVYDTIAQKR